MSIKKETNLKNPIVCHSCGGLMPPPKPSEPGKFCCNDCREDGELKECLVCNNWFRSYSGIAAYCNVCKDKRYLAYEPIKRKASSLGGNVRGGKGKIAWIVERLTESLGSPCKYCSTILTLQNISLDHIEPFGSSELRRTLVGKERLYIDRRENLQLICRKCNVIKDKIPHESFVNLLEFLSTDPILQENVLNRLNQSGLLWHFKRKQNNNGG
jgi:hypothetical protein